MKERIGQIDKEIAVLKSEIRTPLEIAIDTLGGDLEEVVTNKIKLGILEQERKYVEELYNFTLTKEERSKRENNAIKLIKTNETTIKRISAELEHLKRHPNCYIPGTGAYKECYRLEKELEQLKIEILELSKSSEYHVFLQVN